MEGWKQNKTGQRMEQLLSTSVGAPHHSSKRTCSSAHRGSARVKITDALLVHGRGELSLFSQVQPAFN